jgi:hypothetical protein
MPYVLQVVAVETDSLLDLQTQVVAVVTQLAGLMYQIL